MTTRLLAAKSALALAVCLAVPLASVRAQGIPVFDASNYARNVITAAEAVAQTAKQIQQYQTQLQQYENMLRNTLAPAAYIWDQAQSTINALVGLTDTLNYYKSQYGDLERYLDRYQNVRFYRGSPCFSLEGCSDEERAALEERRELASEARKNANDAVLRGLDQQQVNLQNDAAQLMRLQIGAENAAGQMEAIQFANQLASHQANQLLQLRGLLIAQHNAVILQMQAEADRQAQVEAAAAQIRAGKFQASPAREW